MAARLLLLLLLPLLPIAKLCWTDNESNIHPTDTTTTNMAGFHDCIDHGNHYPIPLLLPWPLPLPIFLAAQPHVHSFTPNTDPCH